jgi:ankyrin repeat protein
LKLQNKKQFCYKLINAILLKQVTERPSSARYFIKKLDASFKKAYIVTNVALRIIMKEKERRLIEAAAAGDAKMVTQLIAAGADVKAWRQEDLAIHSAARHGHKEILTLLIDAGADVDSVDGSHEYTPLYLAARGGHDEAVKLLLDAGALDEEGAARAVAWERGHKAVITQLTAAAEAGEDLRQAALGGDVDEVERLIGEGVNVNAAAEQGRTPLLFAAANGHDKVVAQLLESGADRDIAS